MKKLLISNCFLHLTLCQNHSPSAEAAPTMNLDGLFQYSTSRNHKVLTHAIELISSMQTAPTCTRMAASHLMNECKLLENAPYFAKSRPEAYLDSIKTEYAAKLAVCELLSAQPNRPVPPPNCEILVPSTRACGTGGTWWYSRPELTVDGKQCYPELKSNQYNQCLLSLQSTPQYWTSFSNARQNAVVICQASRDVMEREHHIETFKNLTEVVTAMSAALGKSVRNYEARIQDQNRFSNAIRDALDQVRKDIDAIQEKALVTVGTLDNTFRDFVETSMNQLIKALAENQSNEILRTRREMQAFSKELVTESSQIAEHINAQLRAYHERTLTSLQAKHETQMDSYDSLAIRMDKVHHTTAQINAVTGSALEKIITMEHQFQDLATQADHIAQGFALFQAVPSFLSYLLKWLLATCGIVMLLQVCFNMNRNMVICVGCACSSAMLLHVGGYHPWPVSMPDSEPGNVADSLPLGASNLPTRQKLAMMVLLLWVCAYPIGRINGYLGSIIGTVIDRTASYWVQQYSNENGVGVLPSVEVPPTRTFQ